MARYLYKGWDLAPPKSDAVDHPGKQWWRRMASPPASLPRGANTDSYINASHIFILHVCYSFFLPTKSTHVTSLNQDMFFYHLIQAGFVPKTLAPTTTPSIRELPVLCHFFKYFFYILLDLFFIFLIWYTILSRGPPSPKRGWRGPELCLMLVKASFTNSSIT